MWWKLFQLAIIAAVVLWANAIGAPVGVFGFFGLVFAGILTVLMSRAIDLARSRRRKHQAGVVRRQEPV